MATLEPYQGVFLVSFGGPEAPEQVVPFLRSVTAGRGIPDDRLAEVGRHYTDRGGRSPINDENRALQAALAAELARRDLDVPVIWGNRHLEPSLVTMLQEGVHRGVRRGVVVLTSAYPSYSGCRQYREDLAAALAALPEEDRPVLDKIPAYAGHPGFVGTMGDLTADSVAEFTGGGGLPPEAIALVFVTHSIPLASDAGSGPPADGGHAYTRWHTAVAQEVTATVTARTGARLRHDVVYCSRSGPPNQPWLEPDISDHLALLAEQGIRAVVVVPLGFLSDHMEVVYDLDTVAGQDAARLGLQFRRVSTVRAHPRFVAGLLDLVQARAARARAGEAHQERPHPEGASKLTEGLRLPDRCAVGCCVNPRNARPAVCGEDS